MGTSNDPERYMAIVVVEGAVLSRNEVLQKSVAQREGIAQGMEHHNICLATAKLKARTAARASPVL